MSLSFPSERSASLQAGVLFAAFTLLLMLLLSSTATSTIPEPLLNTISVNTAQDIHEVMQFSPDVEHFLTGVAPSGYLGLTTFNNAGDMALVNAHTAYLWSLDTNFVQTIPALGFYAAFAGDEQKPYTIFNNPTSTVSLVDLISGQPLWTSNVSVDPSYAAVSADYRYYAATTLSDQTLTVWDMQTDQIMLQINSTGYAFYRPLTFSTDGNTLVIAGSDSRCNCGIVEIWNLQTISLVERFSKTGHEVRNGTLSGDGTLLALGVGGGYSSESFFGGVVIWDMNAHHFQTTLYGPRLTVDPVPIFSPDNRYVAAYSYGDMWLWDLEADIENRTVLERRQVDDNDRIAYHPGIFSSDSSLFVLGSSNGKIQMIDVRTGQVVSTFQAHSDVIDTIDISEDGTTLITGGRDGVVRVWRVGNWYKSVETQLETNFVPTQIMTPTFGASPIATYTPTSVSTSAS